MGKVDMQIALDGDAGGGASFATGYEYRTSGRKGYIQRAVQHRLSVLQ
jgi:hypothetical protein